MALITEVTVCPLCSEPLDSPSLATSGCAFPREHRLWPFCDAPIHIDCFQDWDDCQEFCGAYQQQRLDQYAREQRPILATGDGWFCGKPLPYPGSIFAAAEADLVEVCIEDWPIHFIAQMTHWNEFLAGGWRAMRPDLHSYALARAEVVISELRDQLFDRDYLLSIVDLALTRLGR